MHGQQNVKKHVPICQNVQQASEHWWIMPWSKHLRLY